MNANANKRTQSINHSAFLTELLQG